MTDVPGIPSRPVAAAINSDTALANMQREAFRYFVHEANPANGLIADKTQPGSPASIAAVGLGLACYPVGVERGFMAHSAAVERTLNTLRFFHDSVQGPVADATGYRGFYYHFLDMHTGRRTWKCELSTIDTALLLAGALTARQYFDGDSDAERSIRELADALYRRADWQWALDHGLAVSHGWRPEKGFLRYRWQGYSEALILYLLGLGSPTSPLPAESYAAWTSSYRWMKLFDIECLYAGPLFIHQLSHAWIDFRGIQDAYMRGKGIDYFENSRRATAVQQAYAMRNTRALTGYGAHCWGITASDGPGPDRRTVGGKEHRFYGYTARGVPFGPDDGSIAPWVVATSLPFAPELVTPTLRHFHEMGLHHDKPYGFTTTFNATYPDNTTTGIGWESQWHYGINQGPLVLMVENFRSELVWGLMRRCGYLVDGLRRAGFGGGWLAEGAAER